MHHKRWGLAGAAATALSVLAGLAMAAPAAAAAGWTSVSVPQTGNNTELNGMSARTSTDAWAVGVQFGAAGQTPPPPVAYHWNGSAWSRTATPSLGVNAGRGQRERRQRRLGGGVHPPQRLPRPAAPV